MVGSQLLLTAGSWVYNDRNLELGARAGMGKQALQGDVGILTSRAVPVAVQFLLYRDRIP